MANSTLTFLRTIGCCLTLFVVLMIMLFLGPLYLPAQVLDHGGSQDSAKEKLEEDEDDMLTEEEDSEHSYESEQDGEDVEHGHEPGEDLPSAEQLVELQNQELLRTEREKHNADRALLALPPELWIMVRNKLDVPSIEILAKVCRWFRHARTPLEKSGRLINETDRRQIHDLVRAGQFERLATQENDEQLACSYCHRLHPIELFAEDEREKSFRDRICVGISGKLRYCAHVTVSWTDLMYGRERTAGPTTRFCKKCMMGGYHPPYNPQTMIYVKDSLPVFMQQKSMYVEGQMLVHYTSIPCMRVGYAGREDDDSTSAYEYEKLKELLQEDTTPLCNHIRMCDIMSLIDKRDFARPLRIGCNAQSCLMELYIDKDRGNVAVSVRRFLGLLNTPASPFWLAAMLKEDCSAIDDTVLARCALDAGKPEPGTLARIAKNLLEKHDESDSDSDEDMGFARSDDSDDDTMTPFGLFD